MRNFTIGLLCLLAAGCGEVMIESTSRISGPAFSAETRKAYVDGEWVAEHGRLPPGAERFLHPEDVVRLDPRYARPASPVFPPAYSNGGRNLYDPSLGPVVGMTHLPMIAGSMATPVRNNTKFLIMRARIDGRETVMHDRGRPEIGLFPRSYDGSVDQVWVATCPCGVEKDGNGCRAFVPGMNPAVDCRHTVEFEAWDYEVFHGFYRPVALHAKGCASNWFNPRTDDKSVNRVDINQEHIGSRCDGI